MKVEFCGAFNGTATLRDGETEDQLLHRIERAMHAALDRSCKRLDINVGVDSGDLSDAIKKARGTS